MDLGGPGEFAVGTTGEHDLRYVPGGAPPSILRCSGNSNGLATNGDGSLLAAEPAAGHHADTASGHHGVDSTRPALNSPNGVTRRM